MGTTHRGVLVVVPPRRPCGGGGRGGGQRSLGTRPNLLLCLTAPLAHHHAPVLRRIGLQPLLPIGHAPLPQVGIDARLAAPGAPPPPDRLATAPTPARLTAEGQLGPGMALSHAAHPRPAARRRTADMA